MYQFPWSKEALEDLMEPLQPLNEECELSTDDQNVALVPYSELATSEEGSHVPCQQR